jgi:KUP system potassium uptake protein
LKERDSILYKDNVFPSLVKKEEPFGVSTFLKGSITPGLRLVKSIWKLFSFLKRVTPNFVEFYRFPHEKFHEVQKASWWRFLKQPPSISWYNKEGCSHQ